GTAAWKVVTTITAVSDARDTTPHSYHYLASGSEEDLKEKVLALAVKEFKTRVGSATSEPVARVSTRASKSAGGPQPDFQKVDFQAFDPSTNNEPVFVLSADGTEAKSKANNGLQIQHHVVLVVRQDIYGDM